MASSWSFRNIPNVISTSDYRSVAFGNGRFVALTCEMGTSNNAIVSTDNGNTWNYYLLSSNGLNTTNCVRPWCALTYGVVSSTPRFVAVAFGANGTTDRAMYSSDGQTWTICSNVPLGNWAGVAFGNNRYVAVCNGEATATARAMTSTDGITWTARTTPATSGSPAWNTVIWTGSVFIACNFYGGGSTPYVMTSPDGITWTGYSQSNLANYYWSGFSVGSISGTNRIVMVAFYDTALRATNNIATSDDNGVTWTIRENVSRNRFRQATTFGNGQFVCFSATESQANSGIIVSNDGINWIQGFRPGDSTVTQWWSVAYGNNTFVATGSAGNTGQRLAVATNATQTVLSNFPNVSGQAGTNLSITQPTSNQTGTPGTFSYSVSNTAIATISGTTLTFGSTGGTATITATQRATSTFSAGNITSTVTTTTAPQVVTQSQAKIHHSSFIFNFI